MAIRRILTYPDPVLLEPTRNVDAVDESVQELVRDMVETMYAAPGVGLAANQVGVPLRVCVVDLSVGERPEELKVLINPEILGLEGTQLGEEGCLSFPEVTLEVERPFRVVVEALDGDGRPIRIEGEDLLARALCHEIEHLDGQTFLRNVSPLKREIVKRQIRKRIKSGEWSAPAAAR